MFNTKKFVPRRTFLKGVGVTLALPMLDAMLPQAPEMGYRRRTLPHPGRRLTVATPSYPKRRTGCWL